MISLLEVELICDPIFRYTTELAVQGDIHINICSVGRSRVHNGLVATRRELSRLGKTQLGVGFVKAEVASWLHRVVLDMDRERAKTSRRAIPPRPRVF